MVSQKEVGKMPKETFFNLNSEKRKKIEEAILEEFSKTPIEKASISNIITNANIPRGSFYQYFEDKEDAIKYIIENFIETEQKKMCEILKSTNGNIFDASLSIFDHIIERAMIPEKLKLYKNIFSELRRNNTNFFKVKKENLKNNVELCINKEMFKFENDEELYSFLEIVNCITRIAILDVVSKRKADKEAKENLKRQLDMLKFGVLK